MDNSNQAPHVDNYIVAIWPTRSLSKKLRDQQDGKVTRWAIFISHGFVPEMKSGGVFIPDATNLHGRIGAGGKWLPCVQSGGRGVCLIKTPKVELQQSDYTWLVDCPERPGVTKKTFNLPLLLSIVHRIRREHFDAIYFESLHTWNLPIMMMSGKAKTYQVIHEVIPHEGDSQVKMVDLMNKAVVKFADTIVLRNKTYIQDMINRYGIGAERVKYLELWRR